MTEEKTWDKFIVLAHKTMIKESDTRELGKIRAIANEYAAHEWIENNTNLKLQRRSDAEPEGDKNQSGYDLISENGLRIQVKYRSKYLHFENTRRHSNKNKGAASRTGHTAYSTDEFDVVFFTRPGSVSNNLDECEFLAVPTKDLEDPKNPGFCRPRVSRDVVMAYQGQAASVLERLDYHASQ